MIKARAILLTLLISLTVPLTVSVAVERDSTGTIEADVLKIYKSSMVVRNHKDGSEIALTIGRETHMGRQFKPGDKVEVVVTPQGVVTSVEPLKGGLRR